MKPADELLSIRQRIKELQSREAEIKGAMLSGEASTVGDFAIAHFAKRVTSRFDRKSAEAELGLLTRFDVKGETVTLMVDELAPVVEGE